MTLALLVVDGRGSLEKMKPPTPECMLVLVTHTTTALADALLNAGFYVCSEHTGAIQIYTRLGACVRLGPITPPTIAEVRMCWITLPATGFNGPTEVAFALLQTMINLDPVAIVMFTATCLQKLTTWLTVSTFANKSIPCFAVGSVGLTSMGGGMTAFARAALSNIDFGNIRTPSGRMGIAATDGGKAPRLIIASHRGRFPSTYSVAPEQNALCIELFTH